MSDKLKFWWPDTGRLTVKFEGNERAVVRFSPSPKAIIGSLRKRAVENAYDGLGGDHQIPHAKRNAPFCELSGDSGASEEGNDEKPEKIEPEDGKM